MTPDAIIVGAGIVGAACARELSHAGLRVLVLDQSILGGGATAAGMGHLVVMDDSEAQFSLTRYSVQLWDELQPALPADVQFDRAGTLWVAADGEEMAEVHRKQRFYSERGVRVETLDDKQLAQAEPNLRLGLAGALRVPGDSVIYPPCAARFLLEQAKTRGTEIRERDSVASMSGRGVTLRSGEFLAAGLTINATGSWSPALTPGLPVRKRKGHLVITDRYPGFVRHQLVELGYLKSAHSVTADSVAFNVQPRINGQLLIGSSRQFGAEDSKVEPAILGRMIGRALEYLPGLSRLSAIRVWTGFRAATPDKLPLIGPCGDDPKLFLATGHEGLGITTSLATGRLLADQILKRRPAIPFEPYLPTRALAEVGHG